MFDLLLYINWNVNPDAFSVGSFSIRWYGILFSCAFIASYYAYKELLKFDRDIPEDFAERSLTYMVLGTIIGARIGDCFFYNHEYYLQNPLEIFYVWRGGLSSHGGALGILTALFILARTSKKPYIWVLDRVVIVIGVAGFFIRTGNLMNSEIYGHATSVPWGFIFEKRGETQAMHPTQIYEALYYALTYMVLRYIYRKNDNRPKPYLIFGLFLIIVFGFRFCIEFIKNLHDSELEDKIFSTIGLNMGQILSAPFIILGAIMLIVSKKQTQPKPATVTTNKPENIIHPKQTHKKDKHSHTNQRNKKSFNKKVK